MIRLVEVGPRDGLQNESVSVPLEAKLQFVEALGRAGLREIEVTSFVSPKWVPQLSDADELVPLLPEVGPIYWTLVPNTRGLERATALGVRHIALFTAASNRFTERNLNRTVEQTLVDARQMVESFRASGPGRVRAYVSTVIECPFEGKIAPKQVVEIVERLLETGVDEISLGETIGVAVPYEVVELATAVESVVPRDKVSWHFHDTRGTGLANVGAMAERGYRSFDCSAGGLGGCPYAPGAGGNVATEDLVYFFERNGMPTGVSLERVVQASLPILEILGKPIRSKVQQAELASAG
jgi:hydroxymethylglutaryl-CoA lyase